jgi:hypothetical protein
MNSCFQHLNKHFMQKKALKMNLAGVRHVDALVSNSVIVLVTRAVEKSARCSVRFVQLAVKRLQYHSNLLETDRYIAEIVSRPDGLTAIDK